MTDDGWPMADAASGSGRLGTGDGGQTLWAMGTDHGWEAMGDRPCGRGGDGDRPWRRLGADRGLKIRIGRVRLGTTICHLKEIDRQKSHDLVKDLRIFYVFPLKRRVA